MQILPLSLLALSAAAHVVHLSIDVDAPEGGAAHVLEDPDERHRVAGFQAGSAPAHGLLVEFHTHCASSAPRYCSQQCICNDVGEIHCSDHGGCQGLCQCVPRLPDVALNGDGGVVEKVLVEL